MRKIFLLFLFLLQTVCYAKFYSQCSQDRYVYENYFYKMKKGTFVDIGAHNGITFSNSYFFERNQRWKGICVEPNPKVFASLIDNRTCTVVNGCVTDWSGPGQFLLINGPVEMLSGLVNRFDPRHITRIQESIAEQGGSMEIIDVQCYLLNDLLTANNIDHVNFLSIDTEGGEYEIVTSIDYDRFQIDVISLEDNYDDDRFVPFLASKGFSFVRRLGCDLLFINNNLVPRTKKAS